jgi:hypothetical protein
MNGLDSGLLGLSGQGGIEGGCWNRWTGKYSKIKKDMQGKYSRPYLWGRRGRWNVWTEKLKFFLIIYSKLNTI